MKQTITDVVSASLTYYGETDLGHSTGDYSWSLKRTSVSGGVTTVTYPVGERGFPSSAEAFRWTDRASLSYSLTPDTTAPTLSTVTIASDNSDTELAKVGDEVTLTIASSEAIQAPTVTIGAGSATVAQGGTVLAWTASRVLASADVDGEITFSIAFKDIGGMSGAAVTATSDSSAVTFDKTVPTMLSAVRGSDTEITVTLSELALEASITKSNAGGFTVVDAVTPATSYAVSAIAPGATDDLVVLTVASVAGSDLTGLKVKYATGGNGTVSDTSGNLLATNATGVSIAAWDAAPTMLSAERLANTTVRVTLSEVCDTATTTKANAGGFTVHQIGAPATTYAVSAIAPNGGNHDQVDLTVADMAASAAVGVTIKYAAGGNGTVADDLGNLMETNATGVNAASWA